MSSADGAQPGDDATAPPADTKPAKPPPAPPWYHDGFAFTDAGCRTEVRVGVLIVLAAVFLWLFAGPVFSSRLFLFAGLPLLLWGVPVQAMQGRRGRPGYPLKLGLILAIGGALMWPEMRWREHVGGPIEVQSVAWLPLGTGLWILLWWPIKAWGTNKPGTETAA